MQEFIAQNQRASSKALDAVRESLQRGQSTVDVAISAGETVSDLLVQMKEKALAAGCDDFDTKPVDFPVLVSKIDALLARRSIRRGQ